MRVASTTLAENILRQLQTLNSQQARLQNQVATGQKLFLPEDDPAAVGRLIINDAERQRITQYNRNAARAMEVSQTTFQALKDLKKLSDRAGEIATLGTSTISPESSRAYAAEINQLIEQGLQISNVRSHRDSLFAGTAVDVTPFAATRNGAGEITSVAYAGNAASTAIPLSESTSINAGSTGATNAAVGDFLNHLIALRDALTAGSPTAVAATQPDLQDSEDMYVGTLAQMGAVQLRIEVNQSQQRGRSDTLDKLISDEADADATSVVVKLSQTQNAYQAALQSATNIMKLSLLDYIR